MKIADLSLPDLTHRLNSIGLVFRTGPFVFRLLSPLSVIAHGVGQLYADYPLHESGVDADFHVSVRRDRTIFWPWTRATFALDSAAIYPHFPIGAALPYLEWGMNSCIARFANQYLMIHAAVVERSGEAAVLAAPSGSGKSTLCAALLASGWRLLSDELTLIVPGDGRIAPIPRPISLKEQSIRLIRERISGATFGPEGVAPHKGLIAHMRPPMESVQRVDELAAATRVVFPLYREGAAFQADPLPKGVAFMRLASNSFNFGLHGTTGFETLGDLIDGCTCRELVYGELESAVDWFARPV